MKALKILSAALLFLIGLGISESFYDHNSPPGIVMLDEQGYNQETAIFAAIAENETLVVVLSTTNLSPLDGILYETPGARVTEDVFNEHIGKFSEVSFLLDADNERVKTRILVVPINKQVANVIEDVFNEHSGKFYILT